MNRTATYDQTIINDTTDATAVNIASIYTLGGLGVTKTLYVGTGINLVSGNITVAALATVDGRDISADGLVLDNLNITLGLGSLTATEVTQLQNIDGTTISTTQWGYLGTSDQAIDTGSAVTFAGVSSTAGSNSFTANWDDAGDDTNALVVIDNTNSAADASSLFVQSAGNSVTGYFRNLALTTDALIRLNVPLSTGNVSGLATSVRAAAESFDRIVLHTDSKIGLGDGTATPDVFIRRSATNTITVANYDAVNATSAANLVVNGDITGNRLDIDNIRIDGNTITSSTTNQSISITPTGTGQLNLKSMNTYISSANSNVLFGSMVGSIGTAANVTAIGFLALNGITDGLRNSAIGESSGSAITTGDDNTTIGNDAGDTIQTGDQNTIVGSGADVSAAGALNQTAIGYNASCDANNKVQLGNTATATLQVGGGNYSIVSASGTNSDISLLPDGSGEVLLNADPVSNLAAATKQYVDGTTRLVISSSFGTDNNSYIERAGSNIYGTMAYIHWPGSTNVGSVDSIELMIFQTSGSSSNNYIQWRVYDFDASLTIAEGATSRELTIAKINLGTVSNLSTAAASWGIQWRETDSGGTPSSHNSKARLSAITMYKTIT